MKRRILSILLVAVILISQLSIFSFAGTGVSNLSAVAKRDLIENWDGNYASDAIKYDENGEVVEWSELYFSYEVLEEDFEYSFTYNGHNYVGDYEYVYEITGEYPCIYISQDYENTWGVGTHEVEFSILDTRGVATIKVVETPLESLVATPKKDLIENHDGFYVKHGVDSEYYFHYDVDNGYYEFDGTYCSSNFFDYVVTYKDGTVYTGDIYYLIEKTGCHPYIYSHQSEENQWDPGTYNVDIEFLGLAITVPVTVLETPVQDIIVTTKRDLIVNYDGEYKTDEYWNENDEFVVTDEYFFYDTFYNDYNFLDFTVIYKDGTVYTGDISDIEEATGYPIHIDSKQDYENQWGIGTNEIQITHYGKIVNVPINVIENPVDNVVVTSTEDVIENCDGYYMKDIYFDYEVGDWAETEEYFLYFEDGFNYEITYNDGTVYRGDLWEIEEATGHQPITNQNYENHWSLGTNEVEVSFLGVATTTTVNVVKSPVESIEVHSKDLIENIDGIYITDLYWNENDELVESGEYFYYQIPLYYTITYKDGTVYTGYEWEIEEATGYMPKVETYQDYYNQWEVGTHEISISYLGFETTAIVNVVEYYIEEEILNGWYPENGKWTYYIDGVKVKNKWIEDTLGWSYLDSDGYMVVNKWIKDSVGWCYLGEDGFMLTNTWVEDSVGWCYVGEDGHCVTNCWKADSKGWCYLDSNGRMVCNNWVLDGGKWYFMDANGYMVSNCWKKDSKGWCYLGSSGAMLTNAWVKDSVGWCYIGADGYCVTNKWVKDSKGWCYLDSNGRMVTNKWVKDSKGWCYVGSSGYMVTSQWVQDGSNWYYIDQNGYMVTGTKVINGKTYKFNSSGVWIA